MSLADNYGIEKEMKYRLKKLLKFDLPVVFSKTMAVSHYIMLNSARMKPQVSSASKCSLELTHNRTFRRREEL